ncbi:MAG: hypothetical protein HYV38_01800 [Candidatus Levybacteria bacterium]|nr:hypothetical protein [Candidatus Levybacteria bacterium]
MPHVSRRKLDKNSEVKLLEALESVLGRLSKIESREFLFSLLSPTERLMLAKRLGIIVLLSEKVPHSSIASALNVTRETVSRVKLNRELRGEGYDLALEKLAQEKMNKEFRNFLLKLAGYSIRAAGGYVKPEIL